MPTKYAQHSNNSSRGANNNRSHNNRNIRHSSHTQAKITEKQKHTKHTLMLVTAHPHLTPLSFCRRFILFGLLLGCLLQPQPQHTQTETTQTISSPFSHNRTNITSYECIADTACVSVCLRVTVCDSRHV